VVRGARTGANARHRGGAAGQAAVMMDLTPAELADALDMTERFPHNTGSLSMLDEATIAYGSKYPDIGSLQRAFASARLAHMNSYRTEYSDYSDAAWQRAMNAAHALAVALRPLGGARIERCKRPTGWGTCNFPLDDDGTCHGRDHTDAEARS
jgi:hypothetical protein